jgi:hypothetical protein
VNAENDLGHVCSARVGGILAIKGSSGSFQGVPILIRINGLRGDGKLARPHRGLTLIWINSIEGWVATI